MPAEEKIPTLTDLVAERVGEGREMTYRALEEKAEDPVTGYRPSRDLLWKVATGRPFRLTPEDGPKLVRAIAAGLGMEPRLAQAAAAYQFTGYVAVELETGRAVLKPGTQVGDAPKARSVLKRWEREESEEE